MRKLAITIIVVLFITNKSFAYSKIKCDEIPLPVIVQMFDVLFYGKITEKSHNNLKNNGHSLSSAIFEVEENYKGLNFKKNIELYLPSKAFFITDENFLIAANYKDNKLYFANPAGTGCKSEQEIIDYIRSPLFTIQNIVINPYFLILLLVVLLSVIYKNRKNYNGR